MNPTIIQPHRAELPLVRTAVLTMLVVIALSVVGMAWYWRTPVSVQDRHLDGELLQGLDWLSHSIRQVPMFLPPGSEAPRCDAVDTAALAVRLKQIAARLGRNDYLGLPQLDCQQVVVVDKAARWLLKQDAEQIRRILHTPTENRGELIVRFDPFRLPGCLFLRDASATADGGYCADQTGWRGTRLSDLPPGSGTLWASLAYHRQPLRGQSPNTYHYQVTDHGTPFTQGRHQWLTLDIDTQNKAQLTAACYTGDATACGQCPWCNTLGAESMYETARARMVGVLVVDANDGGILAAASAHTRCYTLQFSGGALPSDCPAPPTPPANQPWRLANHALEHTAMPASLAKIPLAAGLMETGIPAATRDAMVKDWLVRSDTEAFIDTVFCKDQWFQSGCAKQRLLGIQRMAAALGWNRGCDGKGVTGCGRQDLLDAGLSDLDYPLLAGRLLLDRNNTPIPIAQLRLNTNAIQSCYKAGQDKRWRDCRGADFVNTLAELYGQGNAMTSPIGVAGLLLHLAAAESGRRQAPGVHLLERLDDRTQRQPIAPLQPLAMQAETAQAIVAAMAQTHLRGTAYAACLKAAQPGGLLRCQAEKHASLRLAGKTGTPLFPADMLTLSQWREHCSKTLAQTSAGQPRSERQRHELTRCGLSPFKWYAVLSGKPGAPGWDKAVVVLAERNWNQRTGMVDSVEDHGANVAAEIGLALVNALFSPADTAWNKPPEPSRSVTPVSGTGFITPSPAFSRIGKRRCKPSGCKNLPSLWAKTRRGNV